MASAVTSSESSDTGLLPEEHYLLRLIVAEELREVLLSFHLLFIYTCHLLKILRSCFNIQIQGELCEHERVNRKHQTPILAIRESEFDQSPGQTSLKDHQHHEREEAQDFESDQSTGQDSFEELYELGEIGLEEVEEAFSLFDQNNYALIDADELHRTLILLSSHYAKPRLNSLTWSCCHKQIQCEISLRGNNYKDLNRISMFNMRQSQLSSGAFPGHIFNAPDGLLPGVYSNDKNAPVTDHRGDTENSEAQNREEMPNQANDLVLDPEASSTQSSYHANSDPEDRRDPSSPPGNAEEHSHPNNSSLIKTFLTISAGAVYTLLTIRYSSNTTLPQKAKILSYFAGACNFFGFLFCLFGMLLSDHKPEGASRARIVSGIGYICVAYGFIAVMALQMWDNDLLLWVSAVASVGLFPALIFAIFIRDKLCKCAHRRCW